VTTIPNSFHILTDESAQERQRQEDDDVDQRDRDRGAADLGPALIAASPRRLAHVAMPVMFSSTTIESSTSIPMISERPMSDTLSERQPQRVHRDEGRQ